MTDNEQTDDALLEGLFEQARATPVPVSDALMARVLADAQQMQAPAQNSGWRAWLAALGGLPALGGLVTATCVGFWIGIAPPAGLPDLAGEVFGIEDLSGIEMVFDGGLTGGGLGGFGWDIEEG